MLVYLEQQRFKACLRRCQVVQNRVLFENVLGMRMLLLSGSEASNTCSNMHTIPFSPDMAGPQGKFCPFSSVFYPQIYFAHFFPCQNYMICNHFTRRKLLYKRIHSIVQGIPAFKDFFFF